jgi:hypothetical protein
MPQASKRSGNSFVRAAGGRFVEARTIADSPTAVRKPARQLSYADLVAQSFEGPVLRYSTRLALIEEAEDRGIGAIEARQIIAAAQKHAQASHAKRDCCFSSSAARGVMQFASFAAGFTVLATGWCWVMH